MEREEKVYVKNTPQDVSHILPKLSTRWDRNPIAEREEKVFNQVSHNPLENLSNVPTRVNSRWERNPLKRRE